MSFLFIVYHLHKSCFAGFRLVLSSQKTTQKEKLHIMYNIANEAQMLAIRHFKGACLCVASPGTGKTFVITG